MKVNIHTLGLTLDLTKMKDITVLEALIAGAKTKLEVKTVVKKSAPHTRGSGVLVLGSKQHSGKGVAGNVMVLFEGLEAKHGIGNITRKMLREAILAKKSIPDYASSSTVVDLMKQGVLKYHG